MTSLRRQRRSLGLALLWLVSAAVPVGLAWHAGRAATTERIVADHNTGLAIYGYDPVAYFTDRTPKLGREDLELKHGGVAWRFHNEGNLEAFRADPSVYMPQYGGHDPVGITGNVARAGHPDFWVIHNDRLFLFYSEGARAQFNRDPGHMALQAEVNWLHVSQTLSP
jgi:hypothetical protein